MPNVRLDDDSYLLDYLTPQFHVVVYQDEADADAPAALHELQAAFHEYGVKAGFLLIRDTAGDANQLGRAVRDGAGNFRKMVWAGADNGPRIYLVRPDQHIAGYWNRPDRECVAQIQSAMNTLSAKR